MILLLKWTGGVFVHEIQSENYVTFCVRSSCALSNACLNNYMRWTHQNMFYTAAKREWASEQERRANSLRERNRESIPYLISYLSFFPNVCSHYTEQLAGCALLLLLVSERCDDDDETQKSARVMYSLLLLVSRRWWFFCSVPKTYVYSVLMLAGQAHICVHQYLLYLYPIEHSAAVWSTVEVSARCKNNFSLSLFFTLGEWRKEISTHFFDFFCVCNF